ncbi:hypothetical protein TWF730_005539 [Orbilia blumenaviensis]|uniref:Rhodanese domain-containing protein n=1 Tax=Orbilia blumenaviensis TaxID=1796055 RepID=A0AAV9VIN4_9PEZI
MPPQTSLPRLLTPQTLKTLLLKNPSYLSSTPQIIPINATWFLPNDPQKRTGKAAHSQLRIPHSRFFDIDTVKDHNIPLPHMLPPTKVFVEAMRKLKVRREDHLVFYDSFEAGILAAPRAAWTARIMGHQGVSILNNFKIYVKEGFEVVKGEDGILDYEARELTGAEEYPEDITAELDRVVAFDEVAALARENLQLKGDVAKGIQILDARPGGRFTGKDPEPRAGLSSGHLPGSISVPFGSLLGGEGEILDGGKLREILEKAGVKDDGKTKIASCGTGVTAAVIDLALEEAGFQEGTGKRRVYDGSWTEWAQKADKDLILKD